jgi:hypothetical protein
MEPPSISRYESTGNAAALTADGAAATRQIKNNKTKTRSVATILWSIVSTRIYILLGSKRYLFGAFS